MASSDPRTWACPLCRHVETGNAKARRDALRRHAIRHDLTPAALDALPAPGELRIPARPSTRPRTR